MSLTGDNTAKFWASLPTSKAFGHRRRSSSSGLFNINITEPILAKYKHLAKLHSDSSALGLNAVNKPGLPKGTLFRSSLPATPLTSPMYPSILHQFTERAIQDLLLGKCSTPKGVPKSSSDYELKLDAAGDTPQAAPKSRTNLFDVPADQNIVTRGSLLRPKTLDFKNKIKVDTTLDKISEQINENGKPKEKEAEPPKCSTLSSTVYDSIKEEQEENDADCVDDKDVKANEKANEKVNEKASDKTNDDRSSEKLCVQSDKPVDQSGDKLNSSAVLNSSANHPTSGHNSTIVLDSSAEHNSTIVLDDSSVTDQTVQKLGDLSINDDKRRLEPNASNGTDRKPARHNGVHHNNEDLQQNCLFVTNLPINVGRLERRFMNRL